VTPKQTKTFHLATLTPDQLNRLSKSYRKRGMKEQDDPKERKRLFLQANRMRALASIKAKRLAKASSPEPSPYQTPSSPNPKVDEPPTNAPRTLPQNENLLNRAAWKWLTKAKEQPEPHYLHLLTLAWWGLENGAQGDWPAKERETLRMQLGHLLGMNPQRVMEWIAENEDAPSPEEQMADLLINLKRSADPLEAAAFVLNQIWAVQRVKFPILSTVSD